MMMDELCCLLCGWLRIERARVVLRSGELCKLRCGLGDEAEVGRTAGSV